MSKKQTMNAIAEHSVTGYSLQLEQSQRIKKKLEKTIIKKFTHRRIKVLSDTCINVREVALDVSVRSYDFHGNRFV